MPLARRYSPSDIYSYKEARKPVLGFKSVWLQGENTCIKLNNFTFKSHGANPVPGEWWSRPPTKQLFPNPGTFFINPPTVFYTLKGNFSQGNFPGTTEQQPSLGSWTKLTRNSQQMSHSTGRRADLRPQEWGSLEGSHARAFHPSHKSNQVLEFA